MATVRQAVPAKNSSAHPASPQTAGAGVAERPVDSRIEARPISERFEALLRQVKANRPQEDISLIRKAWEFCVAHHEGQTRLSGEPYIVHPLEVAEVLVEMKLDATAIAAALLHDA